MNAEILKLSALRTQLFRVVDRIIETGEPVEIERNGHRLVMHLLPATSRGRLDNLNHHPEVWQGTLQELDQLNTEWEWNEPDNLDH